MSERLHSFVFAQQCVTSWTLVIGVFETVDEERYETAAQSAPETQRHLAVNRGKVTQDRSLSYTVSLRTKHTYLEMKILHRLCNTEAVYSVHGK